MGTPNTTTTAVATVAPDSAHLMPAMSIKDAILRRQAIVDFVSACMVRDTDFGVIPGTGDKAKPTLLKPGAEKLCTLFGLSADFSLVASETDATGERHGGEPYIYYQYRCTLSREGRHIASGIGSCNSWEKKYRYRDGGRKCPECGKATIIKGKAEYGGGWLCFAKKGGCGAKFADSDPAITSQQTGQVLNPDIFDSLNTLDKMAQKRALIAATLIGVNASEFFTQDLEDMQPQGDALEGDYRRVDKPNGKAPATAPAPAPQPSAARALTLDELVEQAQAMLDNPPPSGLTKAQFETVKATWRDMYGQANEAGLNPDPIPGDQTTRPGAYYQAIVRVGKQIIEHRGEQKAADALPS